MNVLQDHVTECTQTALFEVIQAQIVYHNLPEAMFRHWKTLAGVLFTIGQPRQSKSVAKRNKANLYTIDPHTLPNLWPNPKKQNCAQELAKKYQNRLEILQSTHKSACVFHIQCSAFHSTKTDNTLLRLAIADVEDHQGPEVYECVLEQISSTKQKQSQSADKPLSESTLTIKSAFEEYDLSVENTAFAQYDNELRGRLFCSDYVDVAYRSNAVKLDSDEISQQFTNQLKAFSVTGNNHDVRIYCTVSNHPSLRKALQMEQIIPVVDFAQTLWKV